MTQRDTNPVNAHFSLHQKQAQCYATDSTPPPDFVPFNLWHQLEAWKLRWWRCTTEKLQDGPRQEIRAKSKDLGNCSLVLLTSLHPHPVLSQLLRVCAHARYTDCFLQTAYPQTAGLNPTSFHVSH